MIPAEVLERRMQMAADVIKKKHLPEETGYVLIYFRLGDPVGFMSWMSNIPLDEVTPLLEQIVQRQRGTT